ncbi:hypothetical protein BD310DRAFT_950557 [Dichomitus squalens]|uniref:Uncharacterized protein n=1 Tax=Dichomitus squalens TaxID=114155 RepID=A0A4Q9PNA3_9APHY|nr:hypothetical protein BD310DRAFT_950557 [Dichomitus squalens]
MESHMIHGPSGGLRFQGTGSQLTVNHPNFVANYHLCDLFFLCAIAFEFAQTAAGIMTDPVLKHIAGHIVGMVDELPEVFVTYDARTSRTGKFRVGQIDCVFIKLPASGKHHGLVQISTTYAAPVPIWVLNPSPNTQLNREGLKRALERYRDSPTAVMAQYDLNQ